MQHRFSSTDDLFEHIELNYTVEQLIETLDLDILTAVEYLEELIVSNMDKFQQEVEDKFV